VISQESVEGQKPLISKRFQRTMQRRALWFLESGETVRSAAYGFKPAAWAPGLPQSGGTRVVILTDRHLSWLSPVHLESWG
jgi:hypothetical protein